MTPERDLLTFYAEAGVDALLGEVPVNRFASAEDTAPAGRVVRQPPVPDLRPAMQASPPPPPPDEATIDARTAARSAATLDELRGILEKFEGCSLKPTATQLVFADGNPNARLMFVGEAPGRDEDIEACPLSAAPANCSTACWPRSASTVHRYTSPTSSRGVRRAIARRRRRNRKSVCLSSCARSSLPIPTFWSVSAVRLRRHSSASKTASPRHEDGGSVFTQASARFAQWQRSTRLFSCAARSRSGLPGAISWRSKRRSISDSRSEWRRSRSRAKPSFELKKSPGYGKLDCKQKRQRDHRRRRLAWLSRNKLGHRVRNKAKADTGRNRIGQRHWDCAHNGRCIFGDVLQSISARPRAITQAT